MGEPTSGSGWCVECVLHLRCLVLVVSRYDNGFSMCFEGRRGGGKRVRV